MTAIDKTLQPSTRIRFPLFAAVAAIAARTIRKSRTPRRLHLVETLPLGGKRQLLLIRCDGRDFLIGAGNDAVSSITPISGASSADGSDAQDLPRLPTVSEPCIAGSMLQ